MIKDSGEKQVACTGASRSSRKGRGTASLLPFDAMMELAKHFQEGAEIHAPRNWENGLPLSWYVDSIFSHLTAIMMGETDESHERAMSWNAICFLATWIRIKNGTLPAELDDLPHHIASKSVTDKQFTDAEVLEHIKREFASVTRLRKYDTTKVDGPDDVFPYYANTNAEKSFTTEEILEHIEREFSYENKKAGIPLHNTSAAPGRYDTAKIAAVVMSDDETEKQFTPDEIIEHIKREMDQTWSRDEPVPTRDDTKYELEGGHSTSVAPGRYDTTKIAAALMSDDEREAFSRAASGKIKTGDVVTPPPCSATDLDTNVRDWITAIITNGDPAYQYVAFCDLVERIVKEKPLALAPK